MKAVNNYIIVENIKMAEHVNTTTEVFADEIRKLNPSVEVFPNAVDPREKQFQSNSYFYSTSCYSCIIKCNTYSLKFTFVFSYSMFEIRWKQ